MVKLHDVAPREQNGRDTLSRYKVQTRAAGLASLEILNNKEVDRVFCDWHDDFVIRKVINGKTYYHFIQVKTKDKRNAQWSLIELFGVNNRNKKEEIDVVVNKITDSFSGKLLIHTVNFKDSCEKVVFLTNIHLKDEVYTLLEALDESDFSNKTLDKLLEHFPQCFCDDEQVYSTDEIKSLISKLVIESGVDYLNVEGRGFDSLARETIHQYSEIDLKNVEAKEIINSLLLLIESKSMGILSNAINEEQLDRLAGVGIEDLLGILSLSKTAFQSLKDGGDINALKNVSIIQRLLERSEVPIGAIEYAAKCKAEWDCWYRDNRHILPDFDLMTLNSALVKSIKNHHIITFDELQESVNDVALKFKGVDIFIGLSRNIILGGLFSVIVRSQ
ncbi:hypothetical protein AKG98_1056 [Moritella sp. JT01]|uniref:dsDNA nuclease domain-containing protein n=1 Tax=Moritella sp. JT01 TaxID=756698 RepID=UPI00079660FE|nr:dsDNA nuclease domain-containing protein [Moritella sp. JT01]KXO09467.1 hypothetical protein AKG98_1056 [Moritella sp. JT01]